LALDGPRTVNMQSWNWKGIDVINAHERRPEVIGAALRMAEDRPTGFVKAVVRL
jgi:hypothetical protein